MPRYFDADDFLDLFYVASAGQDRAFVETVEMVIEDAPTADVAPVVHGAWEEQEDDFATVWRCTACKEDYCFERDPRLDPWKINYCPNCGAKMDGKEEQ